MNYFAKNIGFLRKYFNATQIEIASNIGLKRNTWSNYENGASEPSFDGVMRIANYFGISLTDLLEVDLENNINLIEDAIGKNNAGKNRGNSKLPVTGNTTFIASEEGAVYKTQQEIIESLTSAVKGLEASNAYLILENQRLHSEIALLKKRRSSSPKHKP
jgi:Predicted transcriptional regulators